MGPQIGLVILATLALVSSGCGIMANSAGVDGSQKAVVYGGVRSEYAFAKHILAEDTDKISHGKLQYAPLILVHTAMLAVGFPFAAIGDTFMIPTVLKTQERDRKAAELKKYKAEHFLEFTETELNPDRAPKASRH